MNKTLKTITCWLTSMSLMAMGWLMPALSTKLEGAAAAVTLTCSGPGPGCATISLGGASVSYPTLQWNTVGTVSINADGNHSSLSLVGGAGSQSSIDSVARALGVSSSQLATMANSFNSNQPVLYGRYDPISARLHVDIYRAIRQGSTATVEHANFTPYMGQQWAAARYFIPAADQATGDTPGVNPFAKFEGGDDYFHNLQLTGATSVMGLVESYVRAPAAILVLLTPDMKSYTTSSGGFFRKTITTHVATRIIPSFFLIVPSGSIPLGAMAAPVPSFCASDPSTDSSGGGSCPSYAVVTPAAAVLQANGGSYDTSPTPWVQVYQNSQSGWTFLALVIIITIVSVGAGDVLLAAAGAAGGGVGLLGMAAEAMGGAMFTSGVGALAFEAAAVASMAYLVNNANTSGIYSLSASALVGDFHTKNIYQPGASAYQSGSTAPYWATQERVMSSPALENSLASPNVSDNGPYGDSFVDVPAGVYNTLHGGVPTNGDYQVEQPGELVQNNNGTVLTNVPDM